MRKLFLISLFLIMIMPMASATQQGYCVEAVLNDMTPSSVGIDESFTMGILIDNCGSKVPQNIIFKIKHVSPYISIKEPLEKEIGKLGYANSDRFLVYHMKTSKDAKPGIYYLDYELTYYENKDIPFKKSGNFQITVTGDKAELNIASVKTKPILPRKGETVELTLRIENFGKGTANSLSVIVNHSFEGVKESFIGTLDADEDGPALFTFIASESGEYDIPVHIFYQDDFGVHELETPINIMILEKKINWFGIILFLVSVLIILLLIVFYFRTKKAKNKIIRELLGESNHEHKKVKKRK